MTDKEWQPQSLCEFYGGDAGGAGGFESGGGYEFGGGTGEYGQGEYGTEAGTGGQAGAGPGGGGTEGWGSQSGTEGSEGGPGGTSGAGYGAGSEGIGFGGFGSEGTAGHEGGPGGTSGAGYGAGSEGIGFGGPGEGTAGFEGGPGGTSGPGYGAGAFGTGFGDQGPSGGTEGYEGGPGGTTGQGYGAPGGGGFQGGTFGDQFGISGLDTAAPGLADMIGGPAAPDMAIGGPYAEALSALGPAAFSIGRGDPTSIWGAPGQPFGNPETGFPFGAPAPGSRSAGPFGLFDVAARSQETAEPAAPDLALGGPYAEALGRGHISPAVTTEALSDLPGAISSIQGVADPTGAGMGGRGYGQGYQGGPGYAPGASPFGGPGYGRGVGEDEPSGRPGFADPNDPMDLPGVPEAPQSRQAALGFPSPEDIARESPDVWGRAAPEARGPQTAQGILGPNLDVFDPAFSRSFQAIEDPLGLIGRPDVQVAPDLMTALEARAAAMRGQQAEEEAEIQGRFGPAPFGTITAGVPESRGFAPWDVGRDQPFTNVTSPSPGRGMSEQVQAVWDARDAAEVAAAKAAAQYDEAAKAGVLSSPFASRSSFDEPGRAGLEDPDTPTPGQMEAARGQLAAQLEAQLQASLRGPEVTEHVNPLDRGPLENPDPWAHIGRASPGPGIFGPQTTAFEDYSFDPTGRAHANPLDRGPQENPDFLAHMGIARGPSIFAQGPNPGTINPFGPEAINDPLGLIGRPDVQIAPDLLTALEARAAAMRGTPETIDPRAFENPDPGRAGRNTFGPTGPGARAGSPQSFNPEGRDPFGRAPSPLSITVTPGQRGPAPGPAPGPARGGRGGPAPGGRSGPAGRGAPAPDPFNNRQGPAGLNAPYGITSLPGLQGLSPGQIAALEAYLAEQQQAQSPVGAPSLFSMMG